MKPMNKYIYLIVTSLFALIIASCDNSDQNDNPVTIAISPWAGYSFALLAKELGYLDINKKEQIKFITYPSVNESRTAYENGNVDGMFATIIEVIESTQQGNKSPNIVLVTNTSNGSDKILARKGLKNLHDLKGKRIGVEEASLGMYMLNRALTINNIAFNEYIAVHINPEEMKKALEDNLIDAAVTYPPYSNGIASLAPNTIFHSGMISDEIIDILAIDKKVIDRNSDKIKLLIKGWLRAFEFYKNNPEKSQIIIKKSPGFEQVNLKNDLKEMVLSNYNDQSDLFSDSGSLKKAYDKIIKHMNTHNLLTHQIDSNIIINEDALKLHHHEQPGEQ